MDKIYTLPEDDFEGGLNRRIYLLMRKNGWTRHSVGAAIGLAGGMLSVLLGLLLWAAVRLLAPAGVGPTLNVLSNVFFALLLPLLALAACCLDLLEKKPPTLPSLAQSRPADYKRRPRLRPRQSHHNLSPLP
jgi:hypothetical protein